MKRHRAIEIAIADRSSASAAFASQNVLLPFLFCPELAALRLTKAASLRGQGAAEKRKKRSDVAGSYIFFEIYEFFFHLWKKYLHGAWCLWAHHAEKK
jgi:hypothetical protein